MKSLVWVLLALGSSWAFSPGDAVTLRLNPKVGAQYVYGQTAESSTTMAAQEGATHKSRSRVTMTVLESSEDLVKMLATVDQISPKTAGTPTQEGMKMTMSFSPLYQFKDIKVEGGGEAGEMIGKTFAAVQKMSPGFPEKPVRPGDSWTIDLDFEKMAR